MIRKTKKFNNKIYKLGKSTSSKSIADNYAKKLKANGNNYVRQTFDKNIIKKSWFYNVWYRTK